MYKFADLFSIEAREYAVAQDYRHTFPYFADDKRIRSVKEQEDGTLGLYCPIGNAIDYDFPGKCEQSVSYRAPVGSHVIELFAGTKIVTDDAAEAIYASVSKFIHDFETGAMFSVAEALGVAEEK